VDIRLNEVEARVLGALMEKEITTPEYYPLSLNALINACNQKSNRDPSMNLDEEAVREALGGLQELRLANPINSADSRVTKYRHRLPELFNFDRRESAVMCVLLLRGPQTPGELRSRTERMYRFDDLEGVDSTLNHLMQRESPLVKVLPRRPGTKESRYAHLLCGDVETWEQVAEVGATASASEGAHLNEGRLAQLESAVATLQQEVVDLKQHLAEFRKQFD
jgi:uncharacterized protein